MIWIVLAQNNFVNFIVQFTFGSSLPTAYQILQAVYTLSDNSFNFAFFRACFLVQYQQYSLFQIEANQTH